MQADSLAQHFDDLPNGDRVPGQILAALKAAVPRLGVAHRLVQVIDWLFKFTQPQDWAKGGRPIVWPSAALQQDELGLSPTQVKAINRGLIDAGLITMKDSPNGKRYGKRDSQKRIVEAYGFDLSPLAVRRAEFMGVAEEARIERAEMGRLRRRATIARNCIIQIVEAVAASGFVDETWANLVREARNLTVTVRRVEEVALCVGSLERQQAAARERLENLLATVAPAVHDLRDSHI